MPLFHFILIITQIEKMLSTKENNFYEKLNFWKSLIKMSYYNKSAMKLDTEENYKNDKKSTKCYKDYALRLLYVCL